MVLIEARSLRVDRRLADVSLSLAQGEMLGVIGPNGSGKSTLLHSLAGLLKTEGDLRLEGECLRSMPARQRARRIGLMPQAAEVSWSLRVQDVVAMGRLPWLDQDSHAIRQAMTAAGVLELAGRKVDELSGGEQARVWLARVLAGQPCLLLADEPIAQLDLHYQCSVMDVLRDYAHRGHGVILAIHDLSLAARYCDSLCLLQAGRVRSQGRAQDVLEAPVLSDVFGIDIHVDLSFDPPIVVPK